MDNPSHSCSLGGWGWGSSGVYCPQSLGRQKVPVPLRCPLCSLQSGRHSRTPARHNSGHGSVHGDLKPGTRHLALAARICASHGLHGKGVQTLCLTAISRSRRCPLCLTALNSVSKFKSRDSGAVPGSLESLPRVPLQLGDGVGARIITACDKPSLKASEPA